ncbi:MAG: hypothetical protein AB7Q42_21780 [Acidimicrobiia bacterium]
MSKHHTRSMDPPPSDVPPPTKPIPDIPDSPEPTPRPGDPPSGHRTDHEDQHGEIDPDSPGAAVLGIGDAEPNEPG